MVRPCSSPASDKLARGAKKTSTPMAATAQSAIALIGIDIGWLRVPSLSQGQLNVFLAQKRSF